MKDANEEEIKIQNLPGENSKDSNEIDNFPTVPGPYKRDSSKYGVQARKSIFARES